MRERVIERERLERDRERERERDMQIEGDVERIAENKRMETDFKS